MQTSANLPIALLSLATLALAGCGSGGTLPIDPTPPSSPTTTYAGAAFSGTVSAGAVPIAGASVQLYTAGTTALRSGSSALLGTALTTDASGTFSVAAGYACPKAGSQLYLVARGGTPALTVPPGTTVSANPAITLLSPLGTCSTITSGSHTSTNELTTVTSAFALSQFLSTDASLGATSTNAAGLANAFSTAQTLLSNATSSSTPTNATLRLRSAANLLNTCTAALTSKPCSTLFSATTVDTAPTDTLAAALNLARTPGTEVDMRFQLSTASTVFAPALTSAPSDWTLFRTLTGAGMDGPSAVAVDSTGNVWVASFFAAVSRFSPIGVPTFPSGITGYGLGSSYSLAIDAENNVWVPNRDTVTGIGIGTVTELSSTGQPVSGTFGYTSDLFAFPVAIAIASANDAWVANQGGTAITHVSADGQTFTNSNCCNGASGLAIDQIGNIWVANYYGDSVSEVSPTGSVLNNNLTGGGVAQPQAVAIDGSGTVWIANFHGNSLSELAGASATTPGQPISPTSGWLTDANLSEPSGLAIDASGNLWIPNFGSSTLTEVVGLATPVKTPLVGPSQLP